MNSTKQECIPVGCVPAARWPYAEVCSRGGGFWSWGVCSGPGGVCSGPGRVSAPRGRGWGVSGLGGVWSGVYPSMHWGRPPPPLWTDRRLWKYYLGPTSLRPVINFTKNSETWPRIESRSLTWLCQPRKPFTRIFSVLVWCCNCMSSMTAWFCSIRLIHLIRWKSLHFCKTRRGIGFIMHRNTINRRIGLIFRFWTLMKTG